MKTWWVYILECSDKSLYTGITNNLGKRLQAHRKGTGAKYTRAKGVRGYVFSLEVSDKSIASKLEYKVKQLSRKRKLELINGSNCYNII